MQRFIDLGTRDRHELIKVYTDRACFYNGKANTRCGAGVWFGLEDHRNQALRVPGKIQSNQVGKVATIIAAIKGVQHFHPLEIIMDSKYTIEGLMKHLQNWEDQGWIGIRNANLFQKAAFLLRR